MTGTSYESVIGLEVHAQLATRSKIFCACSTAFGAEPNSQTCPVCLGLPGALPVLNRRAVEFALRMILAVDGTVNQRNIFARKNYFYPDLPKGYQISQFDEPIGQGGHLDITQEAQIRPIGLIRIHLEEDAGKSLHPETAEDEQATFVDMNRCGVPLLEIVTQPDITTPEEAGQFLRKLRQTVRYLGICTGNMEEGALRCDANISMRPAGTEEYGVRTEVKNLNSIRSVERALAYEIERQVSVLQSGGEVVQETLLWDETAQRAEPMRSKEESSDYRYFPEPDLLPLRITPEWIDAVAGSLPELRDAKAKRLVSQYQIPPYDAEVLTEEKSLADYFEAAAAVGADGKRVSNWIMTEVLRVVKDRDTDITAFPVRPRALGELLNMIENGAISGKIAKDVFDEMIASGREAKAIVQEQGLTQISDDDTLSTLVDQIVARYPVQAEKYRNGQTRVLGFFVGEAMKQTKGQANPKRLNQLLRMRLNAKE
jgi:aspartyl-tRNA(Asn)/glutamyl-tRNA(Gln) amidotransferase subunit B